MEKFLVKWKKYISNPRQLGLFWLCVHLFFLLVAVIALILFSATPVSFPEVILTAFSFSLLSIIFFPTLMNFLFIEVWPVLPVLFKGIHPIILFVVYYGLYSAILFTKSTKSRLFLFFHFSFIVLFLLNLIAGFYLLGQFLLSANLTH